MGKPVVFGDKGVEFVTARNLGTFEEPDEPASTGDGDERESNEPVAAGSGGDNRASQAVTNPADLGSDAPYGYTPTGRRKRAPGGKRNTTRESGASREGAKQATSDIAELLTLVHWGIATALKEESIELSPDEAEKLAKSITRLTELYGNIPGMDEKTRAWVNLGITTSTIYGTRIIAAKMRKPKRPTVINTGLHNVG
jgi:hypothetical protein